MVKCKACGREMLNAKGCTMRFIVLKNGKYYPRRKVGDGDWTEKGERCSDCGALYGNFHHINCDVERCPICGG